MGRGGKGDGRGGGEGRGGREGREGGGGDGREGGEVRREGKERRWEGKGRRGKGWMGCGKGRRGGGTGENRGEQDGRWGKMLTETDFKGKGIEQHCTYFHLSSCSSGSDLVEPPPTVHLTQSCDIELHRPVSREEGEMVARQLDREESLVDEDVVQQSMELSQRLSEEAISMMSFSNRRANTCIQASF